MPKTNYRLPNFMLEEMFRQALKRICAPESTGIGIVEPGFGIAG